MSANEYLQTKDPESENVRYFYPIHERGVERVRNSHRRFIKAERFWEAVCSGELTPTGQDGECLVFEDRAAELDDLRKLVKLIDGLTPSKQSCAYKKNGQWRIDRLMAAERERFLSYKRMVREMLFSAYNKRICRMVRELEAGYIPVGENKAVRSLVFDYQGKMNQVRAALGY